MSSTTELLHAVHDYLLKNIPEFYIKHGELGTSIFVEHFFEVLGVKFEVQYDSMNECQFFCVRRHEETRYVNFITVAHNIKVQNEFSAGYTSNREAIIKVLDSFSESKMYLYDSIIIHNCQKISCKDIDKDVIFNLSTTLDDYNFDTFKFFSTVKTPFKYIYVNIVNDNEWYYK